MKLRAFSLIELLVVITIVGVIAAIATPTYKMHLAKQRASSPLPLISSLVQKNILFYETHGRFADFGEIDNSGLFYDHNPYLYGTGFNGTMHTDLSPRPDGTGGQLTDCDYGNVGSNIAGYDPEGNPFNGDPAGAYTAPNFIYIFTKSGAIVSYCLNYEYDTVSGLQIYRNIVNGCPDATEERLEEISNTIATACQ